MILPFFYLDISSFCTCEVNSAVPPPSTSGLSQNPAVWEVMRLGKEDEVIVLLYHGFLQDNDDGSQTEIRLDKNINSGLIMSVNWLFMSPLISV